MAPAKTKACILYIDDEHANRVVFEKAFERDFEIRLAETAEQGLEVLAGARVALIVTDQRLPGMLGTELLKIAAEKYPNVGRMILTAYSDLEVVLRAINEGLASRYIIKPWVRPILHEILTWGCDMHAMRSQVEELQLKLVTGERLATMGTLLAGVSHELRNPMSYLTANISTLGDATESLRTWVASLRADSALQRAFQLAGAAEALNELEELPGLVRDLVHGANHVNSLVDGLQAHARRPTGERKPGDPAVALDYATKLTKGMLSGRGGRLLVEVQPLPKVRLSTAELSQVLVNVLTNAADGIARAATGKREIQITAQVVDGGVRFEVRDTGVGMSPEVLAKATEEFFTTKPAGEGTGLGLPICRRVVESVGGTLQLESTVGQGTLVRFWVPQSAALSD